MKTVTGLVSTAMTTTESPFTPFDASAIAMSASTRAALIPSTVIDEVFSGPSAFVKAVVESMVPAM